MYLYILVMAKLDGEDVKDLKEELASLSRGRIEVMKQAREVIKSSKTLIYSLHRGDEKAAAKYMVSIEGLRQKLDKTANSEKLRAYGMYGNAMQEYVEAATYYFYVKEGSIPASDDLNVDAETYLMGLSDLTGELMRKAVNDMVGDDFKSAQTIKDTIEEIYGLMLSLDFDGGEARRKSDQVKWNLSKVEALIFDAKIRDRI